MKHPSSAPLYGRLLALPTNIRLGWKGLPGKNALAYYEKSKLTAIKSFIILATGSSGEMLKEMRSKKIRRMSRFVKGSVVAILDVLKSRSLAVKRH